MLNEVKHLGPAGEVASEVDTHLPLPGQILRVAQDDKPEEAISLFSPLPRWQTGSTMAR